MRECVCGWVQGGKACMFALHKSRLEFGRRILWSSLWSSRAMQTMQHIERCVCLCVNVCAHVSFTSRWHVSSFTSLSLNVSVSRLSWELCWCFFPDTFPAPWIPVATNPALNYHQSIWLLITQHTKEKNYKKADLVSVFGVGPSGLIQRNVSHDCK